MKIPKDFEQRQKNLIKYNNITKRKSYYHKPDEIETRNIKIKKSQTKLNLIKENSIKDIIYSHRYVPINWRRKANYQEQVMNLISKDENFLSYLGNIGSNQDTNKLKTNLASEEVNKSEKKVNMNKKNLRKFQLFRNKSMDERELDIYLTKLGKNYPIKEKLKDLFDEEILKYNEDKNKINDNNPKLTLKFITTEKKKNDINKNIYVQLISKKTRYSDKNKINRAQSAINRYDRNFICVNDFDRKKYNIKDRYAMKQLESVNYYGPYYSYCPECGIRNTEFYKNINTNTLIEIVGQIKKNKDEQILRNLKQTKKIEK